MWSNWITHIAGINVKWCSPCKTQFLLKLKYSYHVFRDWTLELYAKEMKTYLHKNLYTNIHSSLIHNSQNEKLITKWKTFNRLVLEQIKVNSYYGLLFSNTHLQRLSGNYIKLKKVNSKRLDNVRSQLYDSLEVTKEEINGFLELRSG